MKDLLFAILVQLQLEIRDWSDNFLDYVIIDFDDKLIIDNTDRDILHEIDIVNNTVKSFNKTSFTRKINNSIFHEVYYKNQFYGFFKEDNSLNQITLLKRNSDEIFGDLIKVEKFYFNKLYFINYIIYAFLALLLVLTGFVINKVRKNKNKLIIKMDGNLYFNNNKIILEPLCLVVLTYLVIAK